MLVSRSLISASLIAALLIAGAAVAFYSLGPAEPTQPQVSSASGEASAPKVSTDMLDQVALIAEDSQTDERDPNSVALFNADRISRNSASVESDERRQAKAARRAARFKAYNQIPAKDRARALAKQWRLNDQQEQQVAEIMGRYGEQIVALEGAATSDAATAKARREIQSQQVQEIAPILRESPGLKRAMDRFIEAGTAGGGALVKAQAE
ncbi:MAG: hypothetical protein ACJAYC_001281 [Halieaceae bacterium]|jgi:hypothetical protein